MRRSKIAVVGAGIAGLSAARTLSERGHHVTLFEQHPVGHELGSSHGRSRIIRRTYADPFYTECMLEAYPLWKELERSSKSEIVHEVGLLYFGPKDAENLVTAEHGLREHRVPYERLEGAAISKVFPDIAVEAGDIGIFTPEAGWVDASKALQATADLAARAGCETIIKRVGPPDLNEYEKVLVTAGGWIKDWWRAAPVTVTLQTFGYLDARIKGPVWIEEGPDLVYGFPSDDFGLKTGIHRLGREIDPNNPDRTPDAIDLETILDFARRRLSIPEPRFVHTKGCIYTNTESEDFLLSQLDDKTLLASACSGHGFKFGPWFGRLLADIVEDRQDIACYGRFLA